MPDSDFRWELAQQLRVDPVCASAAAGSGHPTSSMSAAGIIAVLLDGYLTVDFQKPDDPRNDHLTSSKGHASPLHYAMLKVAGVITDDELLTYPHFGSRLESHPTPQIPPTLATAAGQTSAITVEDHWPEGGLGEAVLRALATHPERPPTHPLAVRGMPMPGEPAALLHAAGIDAEAITTAARQLVNQRSMTSAS